MRVCLGEDSLRRDINYSNAAAALIIVMLVGGLAWLVSAALQGGQGLSISTTRTLHPSSTKVLSMTAWWREWTAR